MAPQVIECEEAAAILFKGNQSTSKIASTEEAPLSALRKTAKSTTVRAFSHYDYACSCNRNTINTVAAMSLLKSKIQCAGKGVTTGERRGI
jgi:hypothetical protein